jgi:septal ring factor EnvC (AmiA/AmiB activator)
MNHTERMKVRPLKRVIGLGAAACTVAAVLAAALAQDVPGIEICTHESRMDRRTGCLQSNVEFLQQVITKNALDTQQKLSAAGREIAALKERLAAAGRESAALKEALAGLDARIAQLEKTAPPKPDGKK